MTEDMAGDSRRTEDEEGGGSCSSSSCVTQSNDENDAESVDQQLLQLLDSVDQLLRLRESLSQTLSRGWMEIASARYAMGPSRISQPLFSLKQCSASAVVSVTNAVNNCITSIGGEVCSSEEGLKPGGSITGIESALEFALLHKREAVEKRDKAFDDVKHIPQKGVQASANLRQRPVPGVVHNKKAEEVDLKEDLKSEAHHNTTMAQLQGPSPLGTRTLKQRSEALVWFGTLVSPHLRTAQSSFAEALEMLAEMATVQSSVLSAYAQITKAKRMDQGNNS